MLLQSIFAFCAIIGFSVLIEAPKRCLVVNGILGMAGWAIYLYTEKYTSMLMATFMSGLVLAIISHILARIMKTPQQALSSLVFTIGAAGAIALAIFIVDAFVAVIKKVGR